MSRATLRVLRRSTVGLLTVVLVGALIGLGGRSGAAAQSAEGSVLLILDASGSMWGRVDGRTKIEVARDVVAEVLPSLDDKAAVALMAYGHRRKGDCADIEVVSGFDGGAAAAAGRLGGLTPRGKTPLGASLEQASSLLDGRTGARTIVLVSDGVETCGADPCAVAGKLRGASVDLRVHVVGFDVGGDAVEQLQCIARSGGGGYFAADDAKGLAAALGQVRTHIADGTPAPEVPEPAPAPASTRVRIAGPGTIVLQPASWVTMPPYYWVAADAETGEEVGRTGKPELMVKAGTYQLVWRHVQHGASEVPLTATVRVESGQKTEVPVDTGAQFTLPEGAEPPYRWTLEDAAGERLAEYGGLTGPVPVPAGTHRLVWRHTQHHHADVPWGEVTFADGTLTTVSVASGLSVIAGGQPPPYQLIARNLDADWETSIGGVWGPLLLPPGRYRLDLWTEQHGSSRTTIVEELVITDGQHIELEF